MRLAAIVIACLFASVASAAGPAETSGEAFPYPGKYRNAYCGLELHQDGQFEMRGMDCSYPWSNQDGAITTSASGRARISDGHLLLMGLDFLVVHCSGGPRFLPPDEQRDFALAMHSQDDYDLRWRSGFAASPGPDGTGYDCDLSPLPSGLLRIAEAPPIAASIRSVTASTCERHDDGVDCEANLVIDRGEAHGMVQGMKLYFRDCMGEVNALSIQSVSADTATVDFDWSPAAEAHASHYIGAALTTRMPTCLAGERERRRLQAQDRNEQQQAEESE